MEVDGPKGDEIPKRKKSKETRNHPDWSQEQISAARERLEGSQQRHHAARREDTPQLLNSGGASFGSRPEEIKSAGLGLPCY